MPIDYYISKYSVVLPLLAFLVAMVKNANRSTAFYRLGALVGFYLLFELLTSNYKLLGIHNNLFFLLPYVVLEYWLVLWCLQQRNITLGLVLLGTIAVEKWWFGNEWLSISRSVEGLLILYFCSGWFRSTYRSPERKIEKLPNFYLCCGLILYFLPTLPIFLNDAQVFRINNNALLVLYGVKNVLNALSKVLLSVELWRD